MVQSRRIADMGRAADCLSNRIIALGHYRIILSAAEQMFYLGAPLAHVVAYQEQVVAWRRKAAIEAMSRR